MGNESLWNVKVGYIDGDSGVTLWDYIGVWEREDTDNLTNLVEATGEIAKEYKGKNLAITKIEIQPTGITRIWKD